VHQNVATPRENVTPATASAARTSLARSAFAKFVLVGVAAYLVNQAGLFVFYDLPVLWFLPGKDTRVDFGIIAHPDILLLIASMVAVQLSIIFKFFAHDQWTFKDRSRGSPLVRFGQFNVSCFASLTVTVATVNTLTPIFGISPYISNTIGVLAAFVFNWLLSSYLIWPRRQRAGTPA
jgi:putative flippase GtrA